MHICSFIIIIIIIISIDVGRDRVPASKNKIVGRYCSTAVLILKYISTKLLCRYVSNNLLVKMFVNIILYIIPCANYICSVCMVSVVKSAVKLAKNRDE